MYFYLRSFKADVWNRLILLNFMDAWEYTNKQIVNFQSFRIEMLIEEWVQFINDVGHIIYLSRSFQINECMCNRVTMEWKRCLVRWILFRTYVFFQIYSTYYVQHFLFSYWIRMNYIKNRTILLLQLTKMYCIMACATSCTNIFYCN